MSKSHARRSHVRVSTLRNRKGKAKVPTSLVVGTTNLPVSRAEVWPLFQKYLPQIRCLIRKRVTNSLRDDEGVYVETVADLFSRFVKAVERGKVHHRGVGAWFRKVTALAAADHAVARLRERQEANYTPTDILAVTASASVTLPEDEEDLASFATPEQYLIAVEQRAETADVDATRRRLFMKALEDALTARESQVLVTALAQQEAGVPDKDIAASLGITVERFRSYVSTAKRKLELYFFAILQELVRKLPEVLCELTLRERLVLVAYLEGVVLTDIAERLELTEAQVQSYLVAARGKVFHQALKKR